MLFDEMVHQDWLIVHWESLHDEEVDEETS
jgi:hypothetical protein